MVRLLHFRQAKARASHFHLLQARVMAFHFLLRLGSVILQLVVLLGTVKPGLPAGFPRPATAMEMGSRPVVAAVSFVAGSSPGVCRFAFFGCCLPFRFSVVGLL